MVRIGALTGVVLSGGENRRMHKQTKALLPFGSSTILAHIMQEMNRICADRFTVAAHAAQAEELRKTGERIELDLIPGKGPLSGLHAALSHCKTEWVWLCAGDMPFASAAAAQHMYERVVKTSAQAAIPYIGGRIHPLHAVYHLSCLQEVTYNLEQEQYRMTDLLAKLELCKVMETEWLSLNIDLRFVANLNTPEQYENALRKGGFA